MDGRAEWVTTHVGSNDVRQLGYDPVDKMIYWADPTDHRVSRCDLDGNNRRDFGTTGGKS